MSRAELERLRDIRDAIAAIHAHMQQVDRTAPAMDDAMLHDALLLQFVVIGEAVNLIAHEYFRIDIHRVLEVVDGDLPPLEQTIDRLLRNYS